MFFFHIHNKTSTPLRLDGQFTVTCCNIIMQNSLFLLTKLKFVVQLPPKEHLPTINLIQERWQPFHHLDCDATWYISFEYSFFGTVDPHIWPHIYGLQVGRIIKLWKWLMTTNWMKQYFSSLSRREVKIYLVVVPFFVKNIFNYFKKSTETLHFLFMEVLQSSWNAAILHPRWKTVIWHNSTKSFQKELQVAIDRDGITLEQEHNCDKTSLCYKMLPSKTIAGKDEREAPGMKKQKDRITLIHGLC